MKRQKIQILSLLVAFVLCMTGMCMNFLAVAAESSVSTENIFYTSGGASMDNPTEGDARYLTYTMGDSSGGDSVTFRKNLALKWYSFDGEASVDGAHSAQYLNVELALGGNFESFTVALETTQFSMSKEGKTTNELVFTVSDGDYSASVNGGEAKAVPVTDGIVGISLSEGTGAGYGEFVVSVNGTEVGTFKNIGKYYAKYASASATTPLTPLTFKAKVAEEQETSFSVRSLNGQSFLLDSDDKITDNTAPVLVIDSEIKQIVMGQEVSFSAVAMDVCSATATTEVSYYIPSSEGDAPAFDGDTLNGYTLLDSDKRFFENDFESATDASVSIAYKLTDGNSNSAYTFVEWYVEDSRLVDGKIAVVEPESEALDSEPVLSFTNYTENGDGTYTEPVENADVIEAYRTAVTAASKKADGSSIQVGSGAYYYIPSLKQYFSDPNCGYSDMKFTVYYRHVGVNSSSTQSSTADYDALRIQVENSGQYQFRVVATNLAGKTTTGVFEENGEYVGKTITSSNVWDALNLVTFEFNVTYTGPSIEEPKGDDTGYRDIVYNVDDFEIVATKDYQTRYTLYFLELKDGVSTPTLAEVNAAEKAGEISKYGEWVVIEIEDSENADEDDNAYEWNPDNSLSFIPQRIGYYKVQLEVKSSNLPLTSAHKIINVTSEAEVIPGETYWLQENYVSLIFFGIGVLCLIGIVVVLLIKPKDNGRKATLKAKREAR